MIKSTGQILITGVYRTGSEFLAHALNSRPDISVSMYTVNMFRFIYGRYGELTDENEILRLVMDLSARLGDRYDIKLDMEKASQELICAKSAGTLSYGYVYDTIMSMLYLDRGRQIWAEKNQLLWRQIPKFLSYFPNGKCIHIVRDPRAVLMSFKYFTNAHPPAYLGAALNCFDSMINAREQRRTYANKVFVIRFEDLITDTKKSVEEMWSFVGLDSTHEYQGLANPIDSFGRKWKSNSSFQFPEQNSSFDAKKALSGWRSEINSDELNFVEFICNSEMTAWNYKPISMNCSVTKATELVASDLSLAKDFDFFLSKRMGTQKFPSDPHDPSTWQYSPNKNQ